MQNNIDELKRVGIIGQRQKGTYLIRLEEARRRTDETRRGRATRSYRGSQQEELLASRKDRSPQRRPVQCLSQRAGAYVNQITVDQDSLPGYGPVIYANRLVRTRMPGGVGAGGENPPATRL